MHQIQFGILWWKAKYCSQYADSPFFFLSRVLIKRGIGIIQSGIHTTAHNILSSSYISSTHVAAGFCPLNSFNTTLYVPPSTTGVSKVESTGTEISSIRGSGREEGLNNECVAIRRYVSLCKCTHNSLPINIIASKNCG